MNQLPCAVVRDLLPSYAEGLTEPETTRLIQAHLDSCPACAARCAAMTEEEVCQAQQEEKQLDYMKTIRKKNRKKVLLAVLSACLALLLGLACWAFLIGTPGNSENVSCEVVLSDGGTSLRLHLFNTSSALSMTKARVTTENGQAQVNFRQVLASPFLRRGAQVVEIPLNGIEQVSLPGRVVWQDDLAINSEVWHLYQTRTPYVGAMWAVSQVAGRLTLPPVPYHNRLKTDAEPYGWILDFEEPLCQADQDRMRRTAPLALAMVDNMGQVEWTWPDPETGERMSETLIAADFDASLPELVRGYNQAHGTDWQPLSGVKAYADSLYTLQQLAALLNA